MILFHIATGVREPVREKDVRKWLCLKDVTPRKSDRRYLKSLNAYLLHDDTPLYIYKQILQQHGDMDGERWEVYKDSDFMVSNYGRLRGKCGRWYLPKQFNSSLRITLKGFGSLMVHKIVWYAFNGEIPEGYSVVSKNGNPLECGIDNLKLVRKGSHRSHYSRRGVPVVTVNVNDPSDVEYYESYRECSKALFMDNGTVRNATIDKRPRFGYYILRESEYRGK